MADIHIAREHGLSLPQARQLAFRWAEVAEQKLGMDCTYVEGATHDTVTFERPGARGQLRVAAGRFELRARLGLLLGVFRGRIEAEIVKNLDLLLAQDEPLAAFEQGLAQHEAKKAARHPQERKPAASAPPVRK